MALGEQTMALNDRTKYACGCSGTRKSCFMTQAITGCAVVILSLLLLSCKRLYKTERSTDGQRGHLVVAVVYGQPLYASDMPEIGRTTESQLVVLVEAIINPLLEKYALETKLLPAEEEVVDTITLLYSQLHSDIAAYTAKRATLIAKLDDVKEGEMAKNQIKKDLDALETAISVLRLSENGSDDRESTRKYLMTMKASQALFLKHGGRVLIIRPVYFQQGPLPKIYPIDAFRIFLRETVRKGDLQLCNPAFEKVLWDVLDNTDKNEVLTPKAVDRWLNDGIRALIQSENNPML